MLLSHSIGPLLSQHRSQKMTNKRVLIVGLLVAFVFAPLMVANDHLPIVEPEAVGFAAEHLNRIEDHFSGRVERGEIAGIVTLVARQGKMNRLERTPG